MVWKIAKKEFLLNLMTFKFAVGTILCVVLMAVFMPVLVNDYQQRLEVYNRNVADNEAELRKVKVYKNITPTIYRSPSALSVFSEGVEKRLGNSAEIELDKVPEISAASAGDNPYLSIFPTLDVSLIFKIVMSLLALLVAYNVVSGERERGTLKLTLSGTVARYQVLLAKLLAGLMTLTVPITIAFIVGLVILLSFPMADLASSDWARIGLMYVASLVFTSAMYNLGLLFSCLARRSTISLVLGLFLWVVFVVVIPNGSVYLATQIRALEPEEKVDGQIASIRDKLRGEFRQLKRSGGGSHSDAAGAFGNWYIRACDKPCMEDNQKRYAFGVPLGIKYADKFWEVKHSYLNSLFKQKRLSYNLSRISPSSMYGNVMSALAGTDLTSFQYFMDRVRTHRNKVIEYIRSKTDDFSLPSYFTTCREEDIPEYTRIWTQYGQAQNDAERQKALKSWSEFVPKLEDRPFLNLQDFPPFTYRPELAKNLQRAVPDLALLVFVNMLFLTLSFVAFLKYDVRSD